MIFGTEKLQIKCMKCHGKTERHERMMDLTVEIQGDIGTLEEALGKFTSTEILDGENKYLCSRLVNLMIYPAANIASVFPNTCLLVYKNT